MMRCTCGGRLERRRPIMIFPRWWHFFLVSLPGLFRPKEDRSASRLRSPLKRPAPEARRRSCWQSGFPPPATIPCGIAPLILTFLVLGLVPSGVAASAEREYAIPAGPAAEALRHYAQQAGQDLLFSAGAVDGVTLTAVSGKLTKEDALERLLAGSALRAVRGTRSGAIAIVRVNSAGDIPVPNTPPMPMKDRKSTPRALLALLLGGAAVPSGAQSTEASPAAATADEAVTLPAFNVSANPTDGYRGTTTSAATRVSGNVTDIAGSISILTSEFLEDIDPTRIFDATKYLAGVSEGQGDGFYDRQYIRGFQNNRPTVDNFASLQSENADGLFIDHIELVKGPSAILAPSGTPGGQINVISKAPSYETKRSVSATVGRIDAQRVDLDLTGALSASSPLAYRILAGYQDSELNTDGTRNKRKLVGLQLSYKLSARSMVTLRASHEDRWQFVYFPAYFDPELATEGRDAVLAPGFRLTGSRNGTEEWAHRGGRYSTADLLFTSAVGDHISVRFAAKTQYDALRDMYMYGVIPYDLSNRYNPYTGQQTPNYIWSYDASANRYVSTYSAYYDPTAIVRQPTQPSQDNKETSAQLDVAAKYEFRGVTSTTVFGAALGHGTGSGWYRSATTLPAINLYNPVYGAPPAFGAINYSYTSASSSNQQYVNQVFSAWKGRIAVSGGGVRIESQGTNNGVKGDQVSKTIGQYGLVVKPREDVSLYASYSRNSVPGYPNNTLLWQDGIQKEVGAKLSLFKDRLMVTGAYFDISQTNVAVANPLFQSDPNNQPRSLISDIGEHGTELEVMGGLTKNVSVVGSVTWLHQRDSLGRQVIMVPDRTAALFVNYRFEGRLKGLSTFVGTTDVSRRAGEIPQIDFTVLGVVTQPSFYLPELQLWNAGLKYEWSKTLTTSLNIDNVADKEYIALSSGRFLAGVGTPRNIRLTATYRF